MKKHNFGFKKSTRKIPQVAEISSSVISTQHKFQLPAKGKKLKESQTVAQPVTESDFNKFKDEILKKIKGDGLSEKDVNDLIKNHPGEVVRSKVVCMQKIKKN